MTLLIGQAHAQPFDCYDRALVMPKAVTEDMAEAYGWADLALCRAGALTVSELASLGAAMATAGSPSSRAFMDADSASAAGAAGRGSMGR
jgi:UDP-N-acetylglucosamine--N-acetylmuramyl-(pentapeptide) pyrophosphoryl-undecaprenol N-acetylglucosamine transferase